MNGRRLLASAIVFTYLTAASAGLLWQADTGGDGNTILEGAAILAAFGLFAVLGAVLVARTPGHVMGPLFAGVGLVPALAFAGDAYVASVVLAGSTPSPVTRLLVWPSTWYWYAVLAILIVYVPLVFPDGRLPSRRWRWLAWPVGLSVTAACVVSAVSERIAIQTLGPGGEELSVVNPLGIAGMPFGEANPVFDFLIAAYVPGVLGGVAAVIVRFRRSRGGERQQLKWFVAAAGLVGFGSLFGELPLPGAELMGGAAFLVGIVGLPLSITLAILRYRLYEIDRVISRTVTYALISTVLLAVYATIVTLPGVLFALESDLLVAVSTLAAAGVFVPVRRRVQAEVDRRFNRARYDAQQVVERFGARLRDDLDVDHLTADVQAVVAATVQPTFCALWLPGEGIR
ncbi:hypothetical protein BH23ACT10_BH23ACT10_16380 [soil metagenome]